jgi:hypothetical protein
MALPTVLHSAMTGASMHVVHAWSVADSAARLALSVTAADVGKLALQTDTGRLWCLTDDSPVTWTSDYDALLTLLTAAQRGWSGNRTFTSSDSAVLADAGKKLYSNVAGAHTFTIPLNATIAFGANDVITLIQQGAGAFTMTPVSGSVTLIAPTGKTLVSKGVGAIVQCTPRPGALDTWNVYGDLA